LEQDENTDNGIAEGEAPQGEIRKLGGVDVSSTTTATIVL
jgi:hypothetical protein